MVPPRPLLLTNDRELLDDVLCLAAAAGVGVEVVADAAAARDRSPDAALVVVGADQISAAPTLPLAPGGRLVVVCRTDTPTLLRQPPSGLNGTQLLTLPAAEDDLVEQLARSADGPAAPARVIGIIGGCGGAGTSVLAAALAVAAGRRQLPTLLADLDPFGGGLDFLLGLEHARGLRWPELARAKGNVPAGSLRGALPQTRQVVLVSHAREWCEVDRAAIDTVIGSARRAGGVIVLDLPRRRSVEIAVDLADDILVVVPADARAAFAAARLADDLRATTARRGVVVRRLPATTVSSTDVAAAVDLPLLGEIRAEAGLAAALHAGQPLRLRRRGALAMLCDQLLDELLPAGEEAA